MGIASGRLRHQVRIDDLVDVLDSNGDPARDEQGATIREWQEVVTVRAAIEPLRVREFVQSAATQSELTTYIVVRYRAGLTAAMRIVHLVDGVDGRIFNPAGWAPDKDSGLDHLVALCSEGVSTDGQ